MIVPKTTLIDYRMIPTVRTLMH